MLFLLSEGRYAIRRLLVSFRTSCCCVDFDWDYIVLFHTLTFTTAIGRRSGYQKGNTAGSFVLFVVIEDLLWSRFLDCSLLAG